MNRKLILYFLVLLSHSIMAQVCLPGKPYTCKNACSHSVCHTYFPEITLPIVDNEALKLADKSTDKTFLYGATIITRLTLENSGRWDTLNNGYLLWRLKIISPTAYGLKLYFDRFRLPYGAELYIYNDDRSVILGAMTSQNNKQHYKFATQPIAGESITLEYIVPKDANSIISISEVGHAYRDIFNKNHYFDFGSSTCTKNVNCPEGDDFANQKRSVVLISVLQTWDSGEPNYNHRVGWCSGSMVNNTRQDGIPFLLTAFHCLDTKGTIDDNGDPQSNCNIDADEMVTDQWVFIFNYQSANCDNTITQ